MRTTPDECVADPYDDTAMKSNSVGMDISRTRSAVKKTAPLRMAITSRSRPA